MGTLARRVGKLRVMLCIGKETWRDNAKPGRVMAITAWLVGEKIV